MNSYRRLSCYHFSNKAVQKKKHPSVFLKNKISLNENQLNRTQRGTGNARKALTEFTGMMELLIESGLSLKDALEVLVSSDRRSSASALGSRILELIRRGSSFAEAVQSLDNIFPPVYRGMINVGDKAGSVEKVFSRLRNYLNRQKNLKDKISAALVYPVMVLFLAIAGSLGLVFFVMPKLETIFGGFNGNQAEEIRRNIGVIKLLLSCFAGAAAVVIPALIILFRIGKSHEKPGLFLDKLLLRVPGLGMFLSIRESLNFSFAMEVLTSGGVPVETALAEAAGAVSNRMYCRSLFLVRKQVMRGGSLSAAFASDPVFPVYISRWIAVGEKSGRTEMVFTQIRSYFQDLIEQRTAKFLLLIEPALIIAIGVILLGLIMGIVFPLFSVYGNII
jgi:type II secretory pathway component PulF